MLLLMATLPHPHLFLSSSSPPPPPPNQVFHSLVDHSSSNTSLKKGQVKGHQVNVKIMMSGSSAGVALGFCGNGLLPAVWFHSGCLTLHMKIVLVLQANTTRNKL